MRRGGFVSDLDARLLQLAPNEYLSVRQAVCGTAIWGGVGQGKTSASKALASAFLRANWGGLILCAKPEECDLWLSYARQSGRSRSVVIFDERAQSNFLSYELARLGGAQAIGSIVDCLMRVLEACDAATGIAGNTADQFWPQSIRMSLTHCLPLLYSATGNVSVADIIEFVTSAAGKAEQYLDQAWAESSFAARTLAKVLRAPAVPLEERTRNGLVEYWFKTWPNTPEKTRGNISISLAAKLDRFRHGRLKDCFCTNTTVVPDMALHGALIILNMPVLTWQDDGVVAQQLVKLMFMRLIESRNGLAPVHRERPTFIWMDESQFFIDIKDSEFIATCRSARCCVVCLTQSMPALIARLGENRRSAVMGLIGKFGNLVWHGNSCAETNRWAADVIGKGIRLRANKGRSVGKNTSRGMNTGANQGGGDSSNLGHGAGGFNHSSGSSTSAGNSWGNNAGSGESTNDSYGVAEQVDYFVEPAVFASGLRSGGPANGNLVDAVWFQSGARFRQSGGRNYMFVTFKQ